MKLPFDFSLKFIFRLVLPGAVLAAGVWPGVKSLLTCAGLPENDEVIFGVVVVFLGWSIVMLDMHIYMLFEGRRYWPMWLWNWCVRSEERRLEILQDCIERYRQKKTSRREYLEASVELRRFPLDAESGEPEAQFPTRLGNLLAAFENYPSRIYGMDVAFYWPRLWVVLDKDLKEDIDSQQALVDGALYATAAFSICALLGLLYAGLRFWQYSHFGYGGTAAGYLSVAVLCALLAFLIYRVSLHSQAQFGETFKAAFDVHHEKLEFETVFRSLVHTVGEPSMMMLSSNEKRRAVWRYLQNYRVKRSEDQRAMGVVELKRSNEEGTDVKKKEQGPASGTHS